MTSALASLGRRAPRFGYLPALDGLRAVAILAVIAQHSGIGGVRGYHGVTLFFVISGYLITRLLLQEHAANGRISLWRFYARRLARLGPALVVVVLVTSVWLWATSVPLSSWWAGFVGSLTYSTDLIEAVSGNDAVGPYFQWSWSLGVEELFYLIWPVSLLLMMKWRRFAWAAAVLVAAVAGCWALRIVLSATDAEHARYFFAPDTNADALLLGTLVALIVIRYPNARPLRVAGAWAGPAGLLVLLALTWPHGLAPIAAVDKGGLGLAALASAAGVLWLATSPDGRGAMGAGWRPLVFVGKLSYGLYLWNLLTIFVFVAIAGQKPSHSPWGLVWLVALAAICYASWRFIETPLRRRWSPASAQAPRPETETETGATTAEETTTEPVASASTEPVASASV